MLITSPNSSSEFLEFLFIQLAVIVSIVRSAVRQYLPTLFQLIFKHWSQHLVPILNVVEELALALHNEMNVRISFLVFASSLSLPLTIYA